MISERALREFCCGDPKEIENYEEAITDTTQKWHCHHRKELTEDGKFQYSMDDLIKMGEYYKRPPEELIFLTESEHRILHNKGKSDEHREKISKANKAQKGNPYKHFDITISRKDDPNEYMRQYRAKMKALASNK